MITTTTTTTTTLSTTQGSESEPEPEPDDDVLHLFSSNTPEQIFSLEPVFPENGLDQDADISFLSDYIQIFASLARVLPQSERKSQFQGQYFRWEWMDSWSDVSILQFFKLFSSYFSRISILDCPIGLYKVWDIDWQLTLLGYLIARSKNDGFSIYRVLYFSAFINLPVWDFVLPLPSSSVMKNLFYATDSQHPRLSILSLCFKLKRKKFIDHFFSLQKPPKTMPNPFQCFIDLDLKEKSLWDIASKDQLNVLNDWSFQLLCGNLQSKFPAVWRKDLTEPQITIIRASDLKGGDISGKSDPYCNVLVNDFPLTKPLGSTPVIKKTLNPVWNWSSNPFQFESKTARSFLKISVFDRDTFTSDDYLGTGILHEAFFPSMDFPTVSIPLYSIPDDENPEKLKKKLQPCGFIFLNSTSDLYFVHIKDPLEISSVSFKILSQSVLRHVAPIQCQGFNYPENVQES